MFATQPHQSIEFARKVVRALLAVPSVLVLLRPHPSEPPGKYDGLLGESGARARLLREDEIFELVAASDAIVTEYSTVALEGALLGKPAVTVNFDGAAPVVPFVDLKLAVRASSPVELTELISDFASDPSRAAERWGIRAGAAEQLMGICDGRAGLRVAAAIDTARQRATNKVLPSVRPPKNAAPAAAASALELKPD
jgi:hypothetical protein